MKKIIISLLVVLGVAAAIIIFQSAKEVPLPKNVTKEKIQLLEQFGLTQSKDYFSIANYDSVMHPDLLSKYKAEFGIDYISENGLTILMEQNGLLRVAPFQYTGHLDFDSKKVLALKDTLTKDWKDPIIYERNRLSREAAKSKKGIYDADAHKASGYLITWSDGGTSSTSVTILPEITEPEIFIVAPEKYIKLEEGQGVVNRRVTSRDPLLIMRVKEGGYVILAQWF